MRPWEDCGPRDDREADRIRGICPDCGDARTGSRCHCQAPEPEPPPPTPAQLAYFEPEVPF